MDRKTHWERVFAAQGERDLSWFQAEPTLSLDIIGMVSPARGRVIDVGAGTSVLVDRLLDLGFDQVAVLDISRAALDKARTRLGERARAVRWIEADVTVVDDLGGFDVWHDRAVFHFLTDAADRGRYVELARRTVPHGGHLIIAAFADDGPRTCSGLDVRGYNAATLGAELGDGFALIREAREPHATPWGSLQAFFYGVFARR
jgi:SAM-dependent methyltransferase